MRITHRRKKEGPKKDFAVNEGIRAPVVLVLNKEGENLGQMNTGEAIRLAESQELDLVEINPKSEPPVAKILDFGQFQYQQEKEARLRKAHQHVSKTKTVRLSLRIGTNDMEIRKKQAVEFFSEGHKVKVEVVLRGREMQQTALAMDQVKKFIGLLEAVMPIKYDTEIERQHNIVRATLMRG